MRFRGRPVLGAIAGLFFGAFVAVDLQQFGVRPLDNFAVFGFPLIGLALGLALAWWAPFRRGRAVGAPAAATAAPAPTPAPETPPDTAPPA